jgi:hypothetical protein
MARQDTFTPDEWTLLRVAPSLVSGGVSASDPSGIFSSIKEATAGAGAMMNALKAGSSQELLSAMAADRSLPGLPDPKSMIGEGTREQQMGNFKNAVLERVRQAVGVVAAKASPAEAQAYRQMIVGIAEDAANASKEGGFLGFGGVRVSDREHAFITEVRKAAGLS